MTPNTIPEHLMLETRGTGYFRLDSDHRVDHWSLGMEKITGYPQSEVLGVQACATVLNCVDGHGVHRYHVDCPLFDNSQVMDDPAGVLYLRHRRGHRLPVFLGFFEEVQTSFWWGSCQIAWVPVDPLPRQKCRAAVGLIDPLTGLPNRQVAEQFLLTQEHLFEHLGVPYGLVLYDLDRFRHFNDVHGHREGDEMLRVIARTLMTIVIRGDFVFRWGGEEFLVIHPGATLKETLWQAERGKNLIDASVYPSGSGDRKVTVSGGVTTRRKGETLGSVLYRVDEGVYQAKKHGRNQIYCID